MALLDLLAAGQPPMLSDAPELLVGFEDLFTEWRRDLSEYLPCGGGLLRILSAPAGTGKTHLARALLAEAHRRDFLVCRIDAATDHTDDDLSLYRSFCSGLTYPDSTRADGLAQGGLGEVLRRVGENLPAGEIRKACTGEWPAPALAEILPELIAHLVQLPESPGRRRDFRAEQVDVVRRLVSGEDVGDGSAPTRSLVRLRRAFGGPLLSRLRRVPGRRDARLWLETLLLILPKLGYPGTVVVLDEHDRANLPVLHRQIVQLRRIADRLIEGQLPRVFVVYLVLDDFRTRIQQSHAALDQRLMPILACHVPSRTFSPLAECRDPRLQVPKDFLMAVGERIHERCVGGPMPPNVRARADACAREATRLTGPDTRQFVQCFAGYLLDELS